jgi:hypothetical protein
MALTKVTNSMIVGASVNALDFGVVVGDVSKGVANSAAIAAALLTISGGGILILPFGTITIASPVTLYGSISIRGAGMSATILSYTGADAGIEVANFAKVSISDLTVSCTSSATNAINMPGATLCNLTNVIVGGSVVGIYVKQGNENIFVNVSANGCTQDGFYFDFDANNCTLIGCQAVGNTRAGIYTQGPRQLACYSCAFEANGYGAYVSATATGSQRTVGLLLSNCYIEGNATYEVYSIKGGGAIYPRGISIKDCYFVKIAAKATTAIRIEDVDGLEVDGCTFDDVGGAYTYAIVVNSAGTVSGVTWGFNTDKSTTGTVFAKPVTNLPKVTAKAWGQFTVVGGAIATTNLQGVYSVTYVSAGTYEVILVSQMPATDYCVVAAAENGATASMFICSPGVPISNTTFRLYTSTISGVIDDARTVSFQVFA